MALAVVQEEVGYQRDSENTVQLMPCKDVHTEHSVTDEKSAYIAQHTEVLFKRLKLNYTSAQRKDATWLIRFSR